MNTFFSTLEKIVLRDLDKLEREITLFPTEDSLWTTKSDVKNPAGNLCLHLCGNLQHYIGVGLGHSSYQRNREYEFSATNVPRKKLLEEIATTKVAVQKALTGLDPALLETDYPLPVYDYSMTVQYFMIHLANHLGYHLGQVNYLRRLL